MPYKDMKGYSIKFNAEKDADVIARLDSVPNKMDYLRVLIRQDMKKYPEEALGLADKPLTKSDVRKKTLELMHTLNKYLDEN